jgi:uncharacterized protein
MTASGPGGLEMLDRAECLRLLAGPHLGRVALVERDIPLVFPVNYALDGESVVFRTAVGTKLDQAGRGSAMAFEIDHADPVYHTGWSVLVQGVAEVVADPAELARLRSLPLLPWSRRARSAWVRIRPTEITGRRVTAY